MPANYLPYLNNTKFLFPLNQYTALVNEQKSAGTYEVEFNASDFGSGVYFYTLRAGDYVATKKMILMK
jgi:hypothetical protein